MKRTLLLLGFSSLISTSFNGQTWIQQNSNSTNDFNSIVASSDGRIHVFGDSIDVFGGFAQGSHFLSTSMGFSWNYSPLNTIVYSAKNSYFVNDNQGFVVGKNQLSGNGFILKTTNGGITWTEDLPHVEKLDGVHFENTDLGYAVGRNDYVVRTTDGGNNWVDFSANTGDHIFDVSFTNSKNGYIVGRAGVLAHTADSAVNWVNQNSNTTNDLNAVWFVNDSTGWAVGKSGTIIYTSDYGTTWINQNSGTVENLLDVAFVNDTTGWAVGTAGAIVRTLDAGTTWTIENSGTPEDIFSITMRSDQLGWFCGTNGAIYIYATIAPNAIEDYVSPISFTVAPNPFNNYTTLKLEGLGNSPVAITIMDINGKIVRTYTSFEKSNVVIEKGNLNSGIYLLQISNNYTTSTQKLIIE